MSHTLKQFPHPNGVYKLEYPSHWECVQQDEARSCGFGPYERNDVGLWLSILPMSVDTDRIIEDMPELIKSLPKMEATEFRRDTSHRHFCLKADMTKEGEAGHYWLLAGGDVVLFASTQVPPAEAETWNPPFEKLIYSIRITRDEELFYRRLSVEVLEKLRAKHPEEDFKIDEKGIRGNHQVVFLSNIWREVQAAPERRAKIIDHFVNSLALAEQREMGHETWEDAQARLVPVLKPVEYFKEEGPTRHQLRIDWLGGVMICYALRSKKLFRFVTNWDVGRWETDNETVHKIAIANLAKLPWPSRLEGSRQPTGGRVIVVDTNDSLASSRLLHPELHRIFKEALGSPFCAGIPDRDTLVLFSNRKVIKQRIGRRLHKDHHSSPYPITSKAFLVTADGIAPG
jgi:uncharacterized protein YtpQ (UPF0354 family)